MDLVSRGRHNAISCEPDRWSVRQLQNANAERADGRAEKVLLRCCRRGEAGRDCITAAARKSRQDHVRNRFSSRRQQPERGAIVTRLENVQRKRTAGCRARQCGETSAKARVVVKL